MDTYNRSIIGLKSRSNGEYFERMIMAASRFYEDATEKVFILHKAVQYKAFLFVLIYYIMCIKIVFQWRPMRTGG